MFRIKICGITSPEDARLVAGAGADAVGLNFFGKSPRFVEEDAARRIVDVLPDGVVKVGLFVNSPAETICSLVDRLGLDLVQLHGDEPPEFLAQLGDRPAIRAFRLGPEGLRPILDYLATCRVKHDSPDMVMIDSFVRGEYGGTGQTADWTAVRNYPRDESYPPLVLAGGLTPENVTEAIARVGPAAVDTASGVEAAPGRKDPARVRRFVEAARRALAAMG